VAGLFGLKSSYALFIIVLMVLGIVAGAFYFYNAANQNPCGNPGNPQFTSLADRTLNVNGQFKNYHAVSAKFTGTNQDETIASVTFLTMTFNDPSLPHLVSGNCVSDPVTPVSVTVRVTFSSTGLQEDLGPFSYGGVTSNTVQTFTTDYNAGLQWNPGEGSSLTLLVAA
jgi:hypothetical protein